MGFNSAKTEQNTDKTGKKKILTTSRIKYVVIAAILFVSAIVLMILALWTRGDGDSGDKTVDVDHLYSAARYFCRMKYPDNWEIASDDNGFYLDKETGLIFRAYPYTAQKVEVEIAEGATAAPTTPVPLKIPVEGVFVSVFYQPNPDFSWPPTETLPPQVTPSPTPKITPKPTPTFAPYPLTEAADSAVNIMKTKILPKVAKEGAPDYAFSPGTPYEGRNCSYMAYSYQYTGENGVIMKGQMYVCSRAMAYYMITYETTADLFDVYKAAAESMVDNFTLSVFAY